MVYHIRYCRSGAPEGGEITVEASSPTEALVKFRHVLQDLKDGRNAEGMVTSIRADDNNQPIAW